MTKRKRHTYSWLLRHPHYGGRDYWRLLRAARERKQANGAAEQAASDTEQEAVATGE